MVLKSYAKLNLYLSIRQKRKDNYHNLDTLFERIDLCDIITLGNRQDSLIRITCENRDVPTDASNLCYQAARLIQKQCTIKRGVDIRIDKNIPVGSGLGGGSSNAATVLMGLNQLWKLGLPRRTLCNFAKEIGSDVSFFIHNIPFARGRGRGEKIEPLQQLSRLRLWHVLIVPKLHLRTPFIYRKWDEFTKKNKKARLTRQTLNVRILISLLKKEKLRDLTGLLFNELEQVVFLNYPQLRGIKELLIHSGLDVALMSGSGGTIFGITSSKKEAIAAIKSLNVKGRPWQIFLTRTI
ncbi:MAG: 4-(cytidine 5'-diphospho)-2-C-methyl-D-erythritol kinase [Candidatus Omnitrophica bacterium]|nr:4-(cytidine 5'-diphospho)-2-C-methyl-D-erythritol kinase [Candidatus Omnitrophota bacterium]